MITATTICNMALAYLAKQRIVDINEQTETARQCKLFYDITKQELLREYSWGFAKRVAKLSLLAKGSKFDNPIPDKGGDEMTEELATLLTGTKINNRDVKRWKMGNYHGNNKYRFMYKYPEKCVMARKIYNPQGGYECNCKQTKGDDWDLFLATDNVQAIVCNIPNAWIEYTYEVDDCNLFDPNFTEAFARMLAFKICVQVTGSASLQNTQYQLAQIALQKAKYATASEKKEKLDYPSKYFDGRW